MVVKIWKRKRKRKTREFRLVVWREAVISSGLVTHSKGRYCCVHYQRRYGEPFLCE
jgi:hypothetical protein